MTIIHSVSTWLPITQSWLWRQLCFINSPNIKQMVICDFSENETEFHVPVVRVFIQESFFLKKYISLIGWIKKTNRSEYIHYLLNKYHVNNDNAILHSHFGNKGYENSRFSQKTNLKHVVSFYGFDASLLPKQNFVWLSRFHEMLAAADTVLCEGPYMQSQVMKFNIDCAYKVKVLNIGVDLNLLPYKPRQWSEGQKLKVLMAGRFVEKKGFTYGIAALAKLSLEIKIDLTIVGDSSKDEHSQREKQKIIALLKNEHFGSIRMLGLIPYHDLLQEASEHHLFLSPSVVAESGDSEGGCPVIITELAATGMPVISTVHCDIPYVLDQQVHLSEERNVDDLVRQINDWLSNSALWEQRTRQGRRRIERDFDANKQAQKLLDIYTDLVKC